MKESICPYCGCSSVSIQEYKMELSQPYSDKESLTLEEIVCNHCGFKEDHGEHNDPLIEKKLAQLNRSSVVKMLEELNTMGYSTASMERALGLPARTLARWKNEETMSPSAAGLALLRIIRTYPWILAVADKHFTPDIAQTVLIENALPEIDCSKFLKEDWKIVASSTLAETLIDLNMEEMKAKQKTIASE